MTGTGICFRLGAELAEKALATYKHIENVIVAAGGDVMKDKPSKAGKSQRNRPPSSAVRAKPRYFEEPVANVDELDVLAAPPLSGKTHPRQAMADVVPTADDEVRMSHHHPSESATVEFESDPDAADAAADLASDLGADFLEAATRGQDLSDVMFEHEQESTDEFTIGDEEPRSGGETRGSSNPVQAFGGNVWQANPARPPRRVKARDRSSPSRRSPRPRAR